MAREWRLSFRKGDLLAVLGVLVLICVTWALMIPESADGAVVQIYQEGILIKELPLDGDASFAVTGEYTNVVTVSGGSVHISESDCPGEDCVHNGSISSVGRSIVCLPNRVEVRIIGAPDENEVDFVVG